MTTYSTDLASATHELTSAIERCISGRTRASAEAIARAQRDTLLEFGDADRVPDALRAMATVIRDHESRAARMRHLGDAD